MARMVGVRQAFLPIGTKYRLDSFYGPSKCVRVGID